MSQMSETAVLAPFEIWEVQLGNRTIKFFQPLLLTPHWLEDDPDDPDENEYLAVEHPDLDLTSWGRDRRELWDCIRADIREVWQCFVRVPDDRLSPEGRNVKKAFLALAEEVSDG